MIKFANTETTPLVRQMWKDCFGDTDEYIDLYFARQYKEENTLIYFSDSKAVASLQMTPYTITFYGETILFYYLAGLCTLPEYRKKGYMAELIYAAHKEMQNKHVPLSILVPAEEWLFGFYNKFNYEQVFEGGGNTAVMLDELINSAPSMDVAYQKFQAVYAGKDFCVQKTRNQFDAIVEEARLDNFSPHFDLSAMAYIADAKTLLLPYARKNHQVSFSIKVDDHYFEITNGKCYEIDKVNDIDLDVTLRMLCRLLFGFKTNEIKGIHEILFSQQHPIINFMLE